MRKPLFLFNLVGLHMKYTFQIFDAGSVFSLMQVESNDGEFEEWKAIVIKEDGLRALDEERYVYFILPLNEIQLYFIQQPLAFI